MARMAFLGRGGDDAAVQLRHAVIRALQEAGEPAGFAA